MVTKFSSYKFNPSTGSGQRLYSLLLAALALLSGIVAGLITAMISGYSANWLMLLALCVLLSVLMLGLLYHFRLQDSPALRIHTETQRTKEQQSSLKANTPANRRPPAAFSSFSQMPNSWLMQRLEAKADWLEWSLLLLIFLTYTRFSDVLIHSHGLPSIAQPLVLLLLGALTVRGFVAKSKGASQGFGSGWLGASMLLMAYGLVRFASLLYAADFVPAQEALGDYVKDAIIAVIVVLMLQRGAMLRRAIWALLVAGIFLGTISTIQFLTGAFHNTFWGFGQAQVQHIIGTTEDFRIGGPIGEPNFYSQILLPLVALAFERMWNARTRIRRLLAGWALVVTLSAIVFTFSRGALVGLGAMIGMMMLLRRPRPQELLLALLIIVPIFPFIPAQYVERVTTLIDVLPGMNNDPRSEVSFRGRTSELIAGFMMFRDNPILGVGLNNYPIHYQDYARRIGLETRREPRAPHSLYLEVLAELGFLGVLTFGALLWSLFHGIYVARKKLRRYRLLEYANLTTAVAVGLVGYLTAAVFLHAAYPRFLWLLVGIGLAIPQVVRNELSSLFGMKTR